MLSLQLIPRVLKTGFLSWKMEANTILREHWDSSAKSCVLGRRDLPNPPWGQSAPAAPELPSQGPSGVHSPWGKLNLQPRPTPTVLNKRSKIEDSLAPQKTY